MDLSSKLYVPGHDRDRFSMYSTQVGVLKQSN